MANAKQVLDVHVSKGITVAQSNEHMRNWTEKGWKRATDLGNYDTTREHLNFEVVSGGKIRPIDKGRSIPERMAELLHKRGIKDPNEGLEEPRFRTVVNIIFGGSRTRMQELAFGKQEVDFEKGADNRHIKRKSEIERWAKDVYSFVCGRYGEQNIAAFIVHLDELNPHVHCTLLPIKDGKFAYKEIFAGKDKYEFSGRMKQLHTDFYAEVNSKWGMSRGSSVSETGKKHRSTEEYRRMLSEECSTIEENISRHQQVLSSLHSDIRMAERRVKGLTSMVENLKKEQAEKEAQLSALKNDMEARKGDAQTLSAEKEKLENELAAIMAAKRMDLICCCQSEIEFDLGAIDLPFEIECTNGKFKDISPNAKSNYQICISPHFAKIQSWFNGKIIFNHESLKSIIERMKTSVNYIIGTDVNGAPIASTVATDPYTPVFFDKKVQAYYNYQGCRIEELRIISPNFTLRCDNDHNDYVVVFLRDIQDLPYREQCIWKGFNITPDGRTFSKLFQKTIIEGKWNGVAQSIDFVFRDLYKTFVAKWEEKYGWKLFKSLNGIQAEYFNQICILNRDDYEALTDLVKYLSLLLQESLDLEMMEMIIPAKTEIKEKVVNGEKTKESTKEKPLSHLDRILETLNIEGYNFIVFLRNLQSLRSYMLHRNSKKLDKDKKRAFEYFGLNEDKSNSQSVSNNVLSLGATAISNMIKQL